MKGSGEVAPGGCTGEAGLLACLMAGEILTAFPLKEHCIKQCFVRLTAISICHIYMAVSFTAIFIWLDHVRNENLFVFFPLYFRKYISIYIQYFL